MREFVLLALKAWTSPDFKSDELKEAGRLDLVCRVVSNCLYYSHSIRKDTAVHIVMNGPKFPPKIVSFYGDKISGMEFNERDVAEFIRRALKAGLLLNLGERVEVEKGLYVMKKSFEEFIRNLVGKTQLVYLHPKGTDVREFKFKEDVCFIFGDFKGIPAKTEGFLERFLDDNSAEKITLGPTTLFAGHCPILIHNEIDRRIAGWK
jgi:tRNA (pseudouridine54-N1)-methyltransferase